MGVSQLHALGRNRKFYMVNETTYGTFQEPDGSQITTGALVGSAGDYFTDRAINVTMTPGQERTPREDSRQTRSHVELITGKKSGTWSVEAYAMPSGTAGNAGPLRALYALALGKETIAASTVTYSLAASLADYNLKSLTLIQFFNDTFMEALTGCYVNTMTLSVSGGDQPKVTFDGESSGTYIPTSSSSTQGNATAQVTSATGSGTSFDVNEGEGRNFSVGSVISVGGGAAVKVDAVTIGGPGSDDTIDVDSSVSWTLGDSVVPSVPSQTLVGTPIAGILGSLTLDGTAVPIVSFDVSVANNNKGISDEAFVAGTSDYIPGFRDVTGTVTVRCSRDLAIQVGKRLSFESQPIVVTCGDTAGSKLEISVPQAEFEVTGVDTPTADEVMISMPFRGLSSAETAEDEITVTFK